MDQGGQDASLGVDTKRGYPFKRYPSRRVIVLLPEVIGFRQFIETSETDSHFRMEQLLSADNAYIRKKQV